MKLNLTSTLPDVVTLKGYDVITYWEIGTNETQDVGQIHDQADPRDGKKLTFQAIHLQFFVIDIVTISLGKPKTGFGIS
jgi:hypothetical protein